MNFTLETSRTTSATPAQKNTEKIKWNRGKKKETGIKSLTWTTLMTLTIITLPPISKTRTDSITRMKVKVENTTEVLKDTQYSLNNNSDST